MSREPSVPSRQPFFGPWVVRASFVMALFGWGLGFYGPPIFLHAVAQRTAWPLTLLSMAVTLHYLFGAWVILRLPAAHRRLGVGPTAVLGAGCAGLGIVGWSLAHSPWQLFLAALLSGAGWVTMGAVAVNAAIAPWYQRERPLALARAYNGASIGGVLFSPLWVWLIARWGFTAAAAIVGLVTVGVMAVLARTVLASTPEQRGQQPDGAAPGTTAALATAAPPRAPLGRPPWRDRRFVTLALSMAAGLFAQVGLLAHLFSLLVPALGAQAAGLVMGLATACAIAGRLVAARALRPGADRRKLAARGYAVQLVGTLLLLWADGPPLALVLLAVALFGSGIGNATSLPPLIAQAEFRHDEVPRVVAWIVALAQASYAFAPAVFGLVLSASSLAGRGIGAGTSVFFIAVAGVQGLAIAALLAGRQR